MVNVKIKTYVKSLESRIIDKKFATLFLKLTPSLKAFFYGLSFSQRI